MRNFLLLLLVFLTPAMGFGQSIQGTSARQMDILRNYIKDGNAESYTRGFTVYADAAATRPVDGTGGSPTIVVPTVSTTTPIRGQKSFILTKGASNQQGQGWSSPFTIDRGEQAKVLRIEADYLVNSGTFIAGSTGVDSDVIAYIYDVTNSVLIEPSSIKFLSNNTTLADKFSATFQTASNSTSYRLIFHITSSTSTAFSLKVDGIKVTPSTYVFGTPITEWQSYQPTVSPISGYTDAPSGFWRRVGGDTEITGIFRKNASVGVGGTTLTWSLPSGMSIDSTRLPPNVVSNGTFQFGTAEIFASSFTAIAPIVSSGVLTTVAVGKVGSGGAVLGTDVAANSYYAVSFSVPVLGFSSSVKMSDGFDGRVIAGQFARSTSAQSIPHTTYTKVAFDVVRNDTVNQFNTSTNRYTIVTPGLYQINGELTYNATAVTGTFDIVLYVNGSQVRWASASKSGTASVSHQIAYSFLQSLVAGDYVEIFAYHSNSGASALTIRGDDAAAGLTSFNINLLQGPTSIAASERLSAEYTNSAGTSIANAGEIAVPFATKVEDTHGSFVTDTFTANQPMRVSVDATLLFASSTYAAGNQANVVLYKNGSAFRYGEPTVIQAATTLGIAVGLHTSVLVNAGDTLQIRVSNNRTAGATLLVASGVQNFVTFRREN